MIAVRSELGEIDRESARRWVARHEARGLSLEDIEKELIETYRKAPPPGKRYRP
ncbi:MAG: hypothetical protein HY347_01025 [candidate division NC10 bacterium]|nr:hypothetical protein [candidate division NC10 bacterium]